MSILALERILCCSLVALERFLNVSVCVRCDGRYGKLFGSRRDEASTEVSQDVPLTMRLMREVSGLSRVGLADPLAVGDFMGMVRLIQSSWDRIRHVSRLSSISKVSLTVGPM